MASGRIRIEPPNQLPSTGLSAIQYKQWKIALKIFLNQTPEFREFFPGGKYTTWEAQEENPHRIHKLDDSDKPAERNEADELLAQKRINLETMLGIIARYSDEGDFDDIMEKSTSLEWIYQLHERRYNIQRKGRYFNRMDTIRFDKATMTDYHKFYSDLRSCFKSNLMKQGEYVKYKKVTLAEDEKISPTTECLLITIALERIDPRLPSEIDRVFGHRLDDSTSLMDLQTEIFSYIPRALSTLDREETLCNAYQLHQISQDENPDENLDVNAVSYNYRPRIEKKQGYGTRAAARAKTGYKKKFCKVCKALEMPESVVFSHDSSECQKKAVLQEILLEKPDSEKVED